MGCGCGKAQKKGLNPELAWLTPTNEPIVHIYVYETKLILNDGSLHTEYKLHPNTPSAVFKSDLCYLVTNNLLRGFRFVSETEEAQFLTDCAGITARDYA